MNSSRFNIVLLAAIIMAFVLSGISYNTFAQEIKTTDKSVKDTVIKSVTYKLYIGSRGGKYVIRTAKSGNQYKMYIKKP